jgi:hypothetical protein
LEPVQGQKRAVARIWLVGVKQELPIEHSFGGAVSAVTFDDRNVREQQRMIVIGVGRFVELNGPEVGIVPCSVPVWVMDRKAGKVPVPALT